MLAYEYSRPIEVTSIEDLFELYNTGEITDEELERLVALFETKVELNRAAADELYGLPDVTLDLARAIVAYREQVRPFKILDDVSVVPGMSREILDQIRAFARVRPVLEIKVPLTGTLSGKGAWNIEKPPAQINPEDPSGYDLGKSYVPAQLGLDRLPQAYLRFRGEAFNRARVGVVASSSEGIDAFVFEPATQVFQVTKWGRPLLRLEKGYVHLSERRWEAIAGNYMVGFGQRLVFDETSRPNPKGIYADDQVQTAYSFPGGAYSFDYPARLFGVAGTLKGLTLGPTSLEVTGFFSRRGYDLYQYDFVVPALEAVDVSNRVRFNDITLRQQTLPDVYTEQIIGANVTARVDKRTWLGATGFVSSLSKQMDFIFRSSQPTDRDRYGAFGVDFGAALWEFQIAGEYARMDNGSQAFFLRMVQDLGQGELLASVRSYGKDFDNPHSGGFADADVVNRDRDRDELGFYLQGVYRFAPWISTRLSYNQWYRPSIEVWRMETRGRVDFTPVRRWGVALIGNYKDKSLAVEGRSRNYTQASSVPSDPLEGDDLTDPITGEQGVSAGDSSEGDGVRTWVGLELSTRAIRGLSVTASYKRSYEDATYEYYWPDCTFEYDWKIGQDAWIKARYLPFNGAAVTARARYLDEDVYGSKDYHGVQAYAEWTQRIGESEIGLRYLFTRDLEDQPDPQALECDPLTSPQDPASLETTHALRLSFETKF